MLKYDLGKEAKDSITGFYGIITERLERLHGSNAYLIEHHHNFSGSSKPADAAWIDEGRIEILGDGVFKNQETKDQSN